MTDATDRRGLTPDRPDDWTDEALSGPTAVVRGRQAPTTPVEQETGTEPPLRAFSDEARIVEGGARHALDAIRAALAERRAYRDGPLAEEIRQLVVDEERLRRVVAVFDRETVTT